MNLVEVIKERLPDDVLRQLGALIGEGEEKTKVAVSAAVPTVLSAISGLSSSEKGSERLISTLKGLPPEPGGGEHHGGGASLPDIGDVLKKGGDILGPLLGDKLPLILTLLARFSGLGLVALKKVLGFLLPLILRTLADQLKGQLTPGGLGDLLKNQMGHITESLPPGLSLADISDLKAPEAPARKGSLPPLVPVLAIGLAGLALWYLLAGPAAEQAPALGAGAPAPGPAPATITPALPLPTADEVSKALGAVYSSASQTLVDVKDAGSADAALPRLKDLDGMLDKIKALWDRLPEDARKSVVKVTTEHIGKLKDLVAEVLQKPGVADKLKEILATLVARLSGFSA